MTLDDVRNPHNPSVDWSAGEAERMTGNAGEIIQRDGKRVSVEATFTDEGIGGKIRGTLTAVCP